MTIPSKTLENKMKKDPKVMKHYNDLKVQYALIEEMIKARSEAGLTQAEVAKLMGTTQSAIARVEGGSPPSMKTLQKYAKAVGRKVVINLEPARQRA